MLDTDGAMLRGLRLTNSGDSHNDLDAGVQVRGNFNVIKDNRIDNCLFGIDMQQSENNVVRRNHIRSKPVELGVRGDAIRLWYSFGNQIEENTAVDSRDIVVWYSRDNIIRGNRASGGRYSLHFMYSQYNLVEDNDFRGNSVGIFLMYSDSVTVRNNHISHAVGAAGVEGSKNGLFFFGTNGRQANPWGNGTSIQCVTPPVTRAGTIAGNGTTGLCDGAFTQDLNALWCPTCPKPAKNPGAGALVQSQLWYRDPLNTSNQSTSLSNALEFTVLP